MIWMDIDPNVVKPGWTPLIITIVLAAIIVGLFFSMRRQFRRIDVTQAQPSADPDRTDGPLPERAQPDSSRSEVREGTAEKAAPTSSP